MRFLIAVSIRHWEKDCDLRTLLPISVEAGVPYPRSDTPFGQVEPHAGKVSYWYDRRMGERRRVKNELLCVWQV